MSLLLTMAALALAGPELVSTGVWSSPFESVNSQPAFVEYEHEGLAVEVGVAEQALRIYVEERPGEAWRGPLSITVDGTPVRWESPSTPRSVPDPTLYEAGFSGLDGGVVVFVDGPAEGVRIRLPHQGQPSPWLPLVGVVGLWLGVVLVRKRRGVSSPPSASASLR